MRSCFLIIDIGTGNARVGLVDERNNVLSVCTKDTVFIRDNAYPDSVCFDPAALFRELCSSIRYVISQKPADAQIVAVSSTSAREGIVLIDDRQNPYYAMPNVDNRGLEWEKQYTNSSEIYKITGHWLSTIFSALKLVALRERRPDLYKRISTITSISDWIGFMLTGRCVFEYSQACETQLFDIHQMQWSDFLCDTFQIPRAILPELSCAGTILGEIKQEICELTGIPGNTPYIVGTADTQAAVVGTGAVKNDLVIVSGTTSPLVRIIDYPLYDAQERCWIDCHSEKGLYLLESNAGITGLNYQRFKSLFFENITYEEIEERIQKKTKCPVQASLGTLIFKENRSLLNAGFSLSAPLAPDVDKYDFAMAITNDIAFAIASNYKNHQDILPESIHSVIGCGGGMQSPHICRTIATIINRPLTLREGYRQASIIGSETICAKALGYYDNSFSTFATFEPAQNRDLILEQYHNWEKYRESINSQE